MPNGASGHCFDDVGTSLAKSTTDGAAPEASTLCTLNMKMFPTSISKRKKKKLLRVSAVREREVLLLLAEEKIASLTKWPTET
jgi:hypothetical protein